MGSWRAEKLMTCIFVNVFFFSMYTFPQQYWAGNGILRHISGKMLVKDLLRSAVGMTHSLRSDL